MEKIFPNTTMVGTMYLIDEVVYYFDGANWIDISDTLDTIPVGTVALWANSRFVVPANWKQVLSVTAESIMVGGVLREPVLPENSPAPEEIKIDYLPPTFYLENFIKVEQIPPEPTPLP